jgi:hypothetical protein
MQHKERSSEILCLFIQRQSMHLYAPSNHVYNLKNEIIHTYNLNEHNFGCNKEICICIKIRFILIICHECSLPYAQFIIQYHMSFDDVPCTV